MNKGCGKKIMVYDGKSNHTSFCGCKYKGLHLCKKCLGDEVKKSLDAYVGEGVA